MSRMDAARIGGMDRKTARLGACFNAQGPDGSTNAKGAGRPRLLNDEQMQELSQIVETGPDLEVDGVVRWRRIDLVRVIEAFKKLRKRAFSPRSQSAQGNAP